MNILVLSWRGPGHPSAGGAEITTHEHAKHWVRSGHGVDLFTSYFEGAKKEEVVDGVRIIRKGRQIIGVQLQAFVWYLKNRKKYELVVDHFHGIPFFTPLYVRTKKLAFIHEVAREVWKLNPWSWPMKIIPTVFGPVGEFLIINRLYRKILFITVSESTKKDLVSYGVDQQRIEVVKNGVTLSLPDPLPKKEIAPTVIFLGAISEDKGIYDAIRAFSEIVKIDDMWKMWIVGRGSGSELKKMRGLIATLNLKDKIKYFGYVSQSKKFDLLSRSHILLNPSYHEGWCLVNIEANACGLPVVGYNVHGMKDSVMNGKTGILCKKANYKEIAEKAFDLIRNRKKFEQMQQSAIKWSKKFTWEESAKNSLDIIESL